MGKAGLVDTQLSVATPEVEHEDKDEDGNTTEAKAKNETENEKLDKDKEKEVGHDPNVYFAFVTFASVISACAVVSFCLRTKDKKHEGQEEDFYEGKFSATDEVFLYDTYVLYAEDGSPQHTGPTFQESLYGEDDHSYISENLSDVERRSRRSSSVDPLDVEEVAATSVPKRLSKETPKRLSIEIPKRLSIEIPKNPSMEIPNRPSKETSKKPSKETPKKPS
ncbi:hypothetical protein EGW08_016740 [Elysia chlorotica]|uniref:Uncharacterized protein n=1 Tax=Elysia chlorotica TaxID=188477 RepID=A0A433T1S2_ELYCH|nr:hypothetical protein EGW08_016740 [Elysia chlorotica]